LSRLSTVSFNCHARGDAGFLERIFKKQELNLHLLTLSTPSLETIVLFRLRVTRSFDFL